MSNSKTYSSIHPLAQKQSSSQINSKINFNYIHNVSTHKANIRSDPGASFKPLSEPHEIQ